MVLFLVLLLTGAVAGCPRYVKYYNTKIIIPLGNFFSQNWKCRDFEIVWQVT